MKLFITGGAGFIGSAVIRRVMTTTDWSVVNADKLTYASSVTSIGTFRNSPRYKLAKIDICDRPAVDALLKVERPDVMLHLAAESHVDRSIDGPSAFIQTNIVGTYALLEAARAYFDGLSAPGKDAFRFHHVSTDEVFGSLGPTGAFSEETPYQPNSPYSASKAASDHLVRAWHHTFKLPVVTTNCSNNYGPYQFPEKLIPLTILNALERKSLPVYGKGDNIRDWLYVDDHADAILMVLKRGRLGETYNIGGNAELKNLDVVHRICDLVDELAPKSAGGSRRGLVTFVTDRPGHDARYAMDTKKIARELSWQPKENFSTGLRKTVEWYMTAGPEWISTLHPDSQGRGRLGLSPTPKK